MGADEEIRQYVAFFTFAPAVLQKGLTGQEQGFFWERLHGKSQMLEQGFHFLNAFEAD